MLTDDESDDTYKNIIPIDRAAFRRWLDIVVPAAFERSLKAWIYNYEIRCGNRPAPHEDPTLCDVDVTRTEAEAPPKSEDSDGGETPYRASQAALSTI